MDFTAILERILEKSVPYNDFCYMFPPRPKNRISRSELLKHDQNGLHFAQPKLNGDCCLIFSNGTKHKNFGRHRNENLSHFSFSDADIDPLFKFETEGKWNLIVGEFMNTSKKYKDGKPWNNKFVIFDILVYHGKYLLGSTFEDRSLLLDELFGKIDYDEFLYQYTEKIFRVKSFYGDFQKIWDALVRIDMFEGLVLKRKAAKLERGMSEMNNVSAHLKCRKVTKNYTE